uniref:Putative serine/threonine protein kinase n=1 Tax=Pithovirus LCPAC403 TaxID=2506596 RepID=A0A481ZD63_9VIRU|nr:MAG: putative serine/threonine protein kinase [Pithovirus LCPAC403]
MLSDVAVFDIEYNNSTFIKGKYSKVYIKDDYAIKTPANIRELDILVKLRNYPFIVRVLGINRYSFISDQLEIVMEKADMDGTDFVRSHTLRERKRIILHLVMGVEFIHSKGIVHGDIKPNNLLWFKEIETMKISDFGSAAIDGIEAGLYTTRYRAPKIKSDIRRESTNGSRREERKIDDQRQDIWSTGATIFELITGECFTHKWYSRINRLFNKISARREFESDYMGKFHPLCDLLSEMLQKNPSERITASEALRHPFFTPYKVMINRIRRMYSCCTDTVERQLVFDDDRRSKALKYLKGLNYTNRILTQSIIIYDRCRENGLNDDRLISQCVKISLSYFDADISVKLERAILEILSFNMYTNT